MALLLCLMCSMVTGTYAQTQEVVTSNTSCNLDSIDAVGDQNFKSNEMLDGITDGEALLNKITEPYRGRYILVEVWGTWCSPCLIAFFDTDEMFKRLEHYNLVYVYLANNSEDEAWKTVVKKCNLLRDDCVHYNLPKNKQKKIEKFLKLDGYPFYRLISPEGKVLDVEVDPRKLRNLDLLLRSLTSSTHVI